ncbi:MAG: type II toxin-antitoxin system HicB family antitoxin [Candidatus Dadabacteria bacterium]|nr:type II toxin-antitoxin system HicB family antitoxin [Candidatus Dadabacteria bacterium]
MKYLIVYEKTGTGFSAYSPDIPGCIATGGTKREVEKNMKEAVGFHLEGLTLEGIGVPEPSAYSGYVEIGVDRVIS